MRKILLSLIAVLATGAAQASNFSGHLVEVFVAPSGTPGNIRVSISTNVATSCSNFGWYSFDLPSGGIGSVWQAIVLSAIQSGGPVKIQGSGICDSSSVEVVSGMSAIPAS